MNYESWNQFNENQYKRMEYRGSFCVTFLQALLATQTGVLGSEFSSNTGFFVYRHMPLYVEFFL